MLHEQSDYGSNSISQSKPLHDSENANLVDREGIVAGSREMESQLMPIPIRKMITVRLRIFKPAGTLKVKLYFLKEMYVEIPIMNIKNGNTRSVGVNPSTRHV